MNIRTITTTAEFDELTEDWRTLNVYGFGPLEDLGEDGDVTVMVAEDETGAAAYIIAERGELWHVESRIAGKGYAKALAAAANIRQAWEVCTDEGAAFCESLNIPFEDVR